MKQPKTFKQILRQYRRNEANNDHNENALMLVKCFGTAEEVKAIEEIIAEYERNPEEGMTMAQTHRRFEISNKYFASLVKAAAAQ